MSTDQRLTLLRIVNHNHSLFLHNRADLPIASAPNCWDVATGNTLVCMIHAQKKKEAGF